MTGPFRPDPPVAKEDRRCARRHGSVSGGAPLEHIQECVSSGHDVTGARMRFQWARN